MENNLTLNFQIIKIYSGIFLVEYYNFTCRPTGLPFKPPKTPTSLTNEGGGSLRGKVHKVTCAAYRASCSERTVENEGDKTNVFIISELLSAGESEESVQRDFSRRVLLFLSTNLCILLGVSSLLVGPAV